MTTETPKDETPQPEHSTSTSSDSRRTAKSSLISTESSRKDLIQYANGAFLKSSLETVEERRARLAKGRQSEAQRLKEQLSQIPWHAKRAAKEGDAYWLRLAQSYQGN